MIIYIRQKVRDEIRLLDKDRNGVEDMSRDGHVFISYSSKDIDFAMQMAGALKKRNIEYWMAPDTIPAGSNYAKEIPKAIKECNLFLLIYSENAQQSIWVEKEVDMAVCNRKNILPVCVDFSEFNELFKFYLNNVQMVHAVIRDGFICNMSNLMDKISDCIGSKKSIVKEDIAEEKLDVFYKGNLKINGIDKRSNALRMNKIPLECEVCGGKVELKSLGVYVCERCGTENYDDFYKVRSYIEKHGPTPALIISKNTGVSRASIEHFMNS